MKGWAYREYGNVNDVIEWREDLEEPEPGEGQLLVKMLAASVNPVDWKVIHGVMRYVPLWAGGPPLAKDGQVPGGDGVGRVVRAAGAFIEGDVVCFDQGPEGGSLAEYAVVDPNKAALAPKNVSPAAAIASVGLASGTASSACDFLLSHYEGEEGGTFLVLGGAGGVGANAICYLKALGHTVVTTASTRNTELVRSLGADRVIDYRSEQWHEVLGAASMDGIFQAVYSDGDLEHAGPVLRGRGGYVTCDVNMAAGLSGAIWSALKTKWASFPTLMLLNWASTENLRKTAVLVEAGKIPADKLVGRTFSLKEGKEALLLSESGKAQGKVVVEF